MLSTYDMVVQALMKTLKISDNRDITPDSRLRDDLGLDSMSSLIFLMNLEETIDGFKIDPETLDMDYLETVSSITQYVQKQKICL